MLGGGVGTVFWGWGGVCLDWEMGWILAQGRNQNLSIVLETFHLIVVKLEYMWCCGGDLPRFYTCGDDSKAVDQSGGSDSSISRYGKT
jgi:hypothetical protein